MKYMLEVGARTLDDVLAAERGGANRVELYSSPLEGALTPSAGLIKTASDVVNNLLLFVMIRPRAGDFLYSDNEFKTMQRDVEIAVEMGADGIMCGILKSDGNLDVKRMKDLKRRSENKKFILHRAFDFSRKPMHTLDEAILLECDYILTLGQEHNAAFNRKTLFNIMQKAENKTKIILGFGADFNTDLELDSIIKETGACEYHIVNGYRRRLSKMEVASERTDNDDYLKDAMFSIDCLSEKAVRECRNILDKYNNQKADVIN